MSARSVILVLQEGRGHGGRAAFVARSFGGDAVVSLGLGDGQCEACGQREERSCDEVRRIGVREEGLHR